MKLVSCFSLLLCGFVGIAFADDCTEGIDLLLSEVQESLTDEVDYTQQRMIAEAVWIKGLITSERGVLSDCELAEKISSLLYQATDQALEAADLDE